MYKFSLAVLVDSKTLCVELLFILLPLASVELSQALVSQNFQLFVCLRQLSIDLFLICKVALSNSQLLIGLVPLGIASDGMQLASIALEVVYVVRACALLHDSVLGVFPGSLLRCCCLHFSFY